ncbi:synaptic vesicle glycoprotein 2B-like isoform X2 [Sitophilus oryzae]|uniref:Synaptic vesicle glycoprotein 2B-like isoform X2 n=1 Tax=Sitophilus oryzae TaxID=7048 RepID=A0A6J2Y377_SITOR|nr:synaptic vesicle glycoprotein 2B-like isoform X2 [Sitophilus oryzae]
MTIHEEGIQDEKTQEKVKLYEADEEPADFETAITAAGWGKFHLLVYVLSITSGWSSNFETTTMSYVFPAAECDLNLNLEHKGLLNAATYIGMISSGLFWGYLCDTLGRKKLLIAGFLLDGIFVMISAMSQNFAMLITAKFFGGFIINGPFSALTAYLSELHCAKQRSRVQMILSVIFSFASLAMPALAILVLPLGFKFVVTENFVIHAWNVYLFICAAVPLTSAVAFLFLPESPKFLMTTGRNEKALRVFRKIYSMNTGKPEETYPVTVLVNEIELNKGKNHGKMTANRTKKEALIEGWSQVKPLFRPPYLSKILFVCLIQCCTITSLNTLRLWLPQLFQAVNDYRQFHEESAPLCEMLAVFKTKNKTVEIVNPGECAVNTNNYSVYINSMIVAGVTIVISILSGTVIQKVGKKRLYMALSTVSGTVAISLYFSRSMFTTLAFASLFTGTGTVMINALLAVIVDTFPTTLRTMTVSMAMMIGRMGAASGNLIYPLLLEAGCAPPFFFVGFMSLGCAVLSIFLPNTERKPLQ